MKKLALISLAAILAMVGTGCKKENATPSAATTTDPIVGSWKISLFVKDSVNLTNQFNGYTFICNSNGGMTIQGNSYNYNNCNWSWDDTNHSMCHFHIMGCDNNSILWECDDDWDLTSHDSNHCYFSSHNPNHHSTMTWTKI